MLLRVLILSSMALLAGCATTFAPDIVYSDKGHPLSDTAVFSTTPAEGATTSSQIIKVDGESPDCWKEGCPLWVRVLPGSHTFTIQVRKFNGLGFKALLFQIGTKDVAINNMQPRHVYVAHYEISEDQKHFSVQVDDLGENPNYGLYTEIAGMNRKYHPVKFSQ